MGNFTSYGESRKIIYIDKLPEKVFIRAFAVQDIVKFKLTNGAIYIKSMLNGNKVVDMKYFCENYRYLSGRPIKPIGLSASKVYNGVMYLKLPVNFIVIPSGIEAILNGKRVESGKVVFYLVNNEGEPCNFRVMPSGVFRKLCATPYTNRIRRAAQDRRKDTRIFNIIDGLRSRGKAGSSSSTKKQQIYSKPMEKTSGLYGGNTWNDCRTPVKSDIRNQGDSSRNVVRVRINKEAQKSAGSTPQKVDRRLVAVARSVDMKGMLNGIWLSDGARVRRLSISDVAYYCSKGAIKNITLVNSNINGVNKTFLRGVGIKIEDLPVK